MSVRSAAPILPQRFSAAGAKIACSGEAGFTMIEIMVALVILVVLMGGVYTCFVSVADTADIARTASDELRVQQYLWNHVNEHLGSICANASGEYALVGEDESGSFGAADTLRFTSMLSMSGAKALPGIVKQVEYHIDDPSTSEEGGFQTFSIDEAPAEEPLGVTLFITESPLVLLADSEGETFFEPADVEEDTGWERELPIRSINFQYYDGVAEEWVDEWNSDETGILPWAVKVQVNLAKTEGQLMEEASMGINPQEDFDLETTVVLPAGAGVLGEFVDPNHRRATEVAAEGVEEN